MITMQPVREALVEITDHGIALAWFVILRFVEDAGGGLTIVGGPSVQLGRTPIEFLLLWIGAGEQLLVSRIAGRRILHVIQLGTPLVRFPREYQSRSVGGKQMPAVDYRFLVYDSCRVP